MVADMPSLLGTGTAVIPGCVLIPLKDDTHRSFSDDDDELALHFELPAAAAVATGDDGSALLVAAATLSVLARRLGSGLRADTVASVLRSLMGRGWYERRRFQLGGSSFEAERGMRSSGFIFGMTIRGDGSFWSDAFLSVIDGMRTGDDSVTCGTMNHEIMIRRRKCICSPSVVHTKVGRF